MKDTDREPATTDDSKYLAPACGVLLVDKPSGMTSHDVIDRVRRFTGIRKVGHAGTLDPFATGLLIVLVGKATRLSSYFTSLDKEYQVVVQFGSSSTTGDVDGEITAADSPPPVTTEALRAKLPRFTGVIKQKAHAYSAVKVGGEPLYRKARRGEEVEAPVREIEIGSISVDSFDPLSQRAVLTVSCSKGTYIRQLCEDIAAGLGTAAYAAELRRTRSGEFSVDAAASLEELGDVPREKLLAETNPSFISCLGALYFLPVRELDEKEARAVASGRGISGSEDRPLRLARDGRLLAIYGPGEVSGQLRPLVVLA
ncbi:MAG: tRNA pseudouridine(55) synthase TruB [Actinobacteria bacterium]|nr:tRNA pseudouridine(55) synthase TruB [Actinomycetota bacterium]